MTVEKEWELLGVILERMSGLYGKYKDILLEQRKALVENRVKDLLSLHSDMENVNDALQRLEQRRLGHMTALSESAGDELLNIKDLLRTYPQLDAQYLQSRADTLKASVAEVRKLTQCNVHLLETSQSVVRVTMQTILSQNTDPRDKAWRTYGASGSYARTVRRETVHIVNRRG